MGPCGEINSHILKLVGGIPTPLKNIKVNIYDYSQLNGKIKVMFQTTNQKSKYIKREMTNETSL